MGIQSDLYDYLRLGGPVQFFNQSTNCTFVLFYIFLLRYIAFIIRENRNVTRSS